MDGVGYARIIDGDVADARTRALREALRDLALRARATVRAHSRYSLSVGASERVENFEDLVRVSTFQILVARHLREDLDLRAGVYRIYIWMSEDEFLESLVETEKARKRQVALAGELYERARKEGEKDPLSAQKTLKEARDLLEAAGALGESAEPTPSTLYGRIEEALKALEARVSQGGREYLLAEVALKEARLESAGRHLGEADRLLPDPKRGAALRETIAQRKRKVQALKREAENLRAERRLEEALSTYQEALGLDTEDKEVQSAIRQLRQAIADARERRKRMLVSGLLEGLKVLAVTLGLVLIVAASVASGGTVYIPPPHSR
jgi:tetratricopeptide (TPR) repeat protein